MNKDELLELIDIFKLLKSNYVVSYGNTIIGCDKNFVCFKKIEYDKPLPTLAMDLLEVSKLLKEYDNISNINITDNNIYNGLMQMMFKVANVQSQFINISSFIDIQNNDSFAEANSLKTTQGIKNIIMDNKYVIPIYNGLLPTVKGDKVDLVVYELPKYDMQSIQSQILCKFIIHKKKKIDIEVCLLCRHIM